ncbi:citronellol/citronellal dehydrogenase [Tistlia consotensis]|uniref:Citronellol/citronellal dehydrogenase n=1 Tax=Tistlia consotensis USBA 355 TaxID=560819 RepID=A0A1Y6B4R9_9PROT|nr:NAD(P)-dependent oxidoreductase [Tistlia consotensis]SME89312.1 citronellol/citronellal dehydrogenase [Tistlia consotensis USBA 355]SNR25867.1 citronellol/citronellal dehydrogenase [Tistlia consotensis]
MSGTLKGRTILVTGASRGIGRAIALRAAAEGANVVIAAKSDVAHPKLPGTIHSVAEEVRAAGGRALAVKLDVRDEASIAATVEATAEAFGGLDAVVNNAGAIRLEPAARLELKRFDLLHQVNTRALLAVTKAALPLLEASDNPHVLSLSPPLNLEPRWLAPYIPYTVTKYAMTLLTMGLAEELRDKGIAVNTLWPRTTIATAAVRFEVGEALIERSRTPAIVADAACLILSAPATELTGQTLIDEDLLRRFGETDFERYRNGPPGAELALDLFIDA